MRGRDGLFGFFYNHDDASIDERLERAKKGLHAVKNGCYSWQDDQNRELVRVSELNDAKKELEKRVNKEEQNHSISKDIWGDFAYRERREARLAKLQNERDFLNKIGSDEFVREAYEKTPEDLRRERTARYY